MLSLTSLGLLAAACAVDTGDGDASLEATQTATAESAYTIGLPPGYDIPTTGDANPGFAKVDAAIRKFMDERCIGAAVIGIGNKGTVIHNRGFGYKKGPPNAKCATAADPFIGGEKMGAADPMRVGSNSKAILASVFRKELKKALSAKRGGAVVTDDDIAALKLIDNGEIELVAPRVRTAMLSNQNDPNELDDIASEPCIPKAWTKVTLGQLLTHRAGLSSSESAYADLSKTRGLDTPLKLAIQQNASGAPAAARTALKAARGNDAYFVPRANLEEGMVAQGNRCFAYTPGTQTNYSNGGFTMLSYVLEHVTGRSFAAPNGSPGAHATSLLAEFMEEELGFTNGIEHSHTVPGTRDVAEPSYRTWDGAQQTYYPLVSDDKRPWCVLSGTGCDFTGFEKKWTRFSWDWTQNKVEHTYALNSTAPGTGLLAVEAPRMLAWMGKYTVGTPYGGDHTKFKGFHQHFGGLGGTASWVVQTSGGSFGYPGFGKNADGTTSFELAKRRPGSCTIPQGIDVIFSINQTADAKCNEANGCVVCVDAECSDKASAYTEGYYSGLVAEALCSVDWSVGPQ